MAKAVDMVLGKNTTSYDGSYDPDILVPIPRIDNRKIYNMTNENVPFKGIDVWHAWEVSFLTNLGKPINGALKMMIPSDSEFTVESKSFKLYLFSFNMIKLGETVSDAEKEFVKRVEKDLSELCKTNVRVYFHNDLNSVGESFFSPSGAEDLDTYVDSLVEYTEYSEDPLLLEEDNESTEPFFIQCNALRSKCKFTGQPDMGTVWIYFNPGDKSIDKTSLMKYIISFRNEKHFHEEIIECMYKRIWDRFQPRELGVTAWYTRRGGIDICPVRASDFTTLSTLDINTKLISKDIDYRILRS